MSKSLAKNREKRLNAGSKMSQLLDAEEEDDFYKTTYGGFDDVFYHLFIFFYLNPFVFCFQFFFVNFYLLFN